MTFEVRSTRTSMFDTPDTPPIPNARRTSSAWIIDLTADELMALLDRYARIELRKAGHGDLLPILQI